MDLLRTPGNYGINGAGHAQVAACFEWPIRRGVCAIIPAFFVWLYGSDNPPPPTWRNVLADFDDADGPILSVSSASAAPTTVTGNSGVKNAALTEICSPVYWLVDATAGGAYGYNTKPARPCNSTLDERKRFIPKEHL